MSDYPSSHRDSDESSPRGGEGGADSFDTPSHSAFSERSAAMEEEDEALLAGLEAAGSDASARGEPISSPPSARMQPRHHDDSDSDDDEENNLRRPNAREVELRNGAVPPEHAGQYCSNVVTTSRYTVWSFVPKNLFEQFSELANLYFLFIGILQIVPQISTTQGYPTIYLPLAFIVLVSAVRAAVEDIARHRADTKTSSTPYMVYDAEKRGFELKRSGDIAVGDVVMVRQDEPVPADMILLSSSDARNGQAFVDKKSLNGETSLEIMLAVRETYDVFKHPKTLSKLNCRLVADPPDGVLDRFAGVLELQGLRDAARGDDEFWRADFRAPASSNAAQSVAAGDGSFALPPGASSIDEGPVVAQLDHKVLMLRETTLRNTDWAFGLVVYTGSDTKIRQNVVISRVARKWYQKPDLKRTAIFKLVDSFLLYMLLIQIALCLIAGIFACFWHYYHRHIWYIKFASSPIVTGILSFFSFFIILSQMVPISLIVSSELVKMFLSYLIESDHSMYSPEKDEHARCNKSTIHEDLGQVEYVLTDKTGTLTKNKMEFRYALVMDVSSARSAPSCSTDPAFMPESMSGSLFAAGRPAPGHEPTVQGLNVSAADAEWASVMSFGKMETEMSKRAAARELDFQDEQEARRQGRPVKPRPAPFWTGLAAHVQEIQSAGVESFPHSTALLNSLWGRNDAPPASSQNLFASSAGESSAAESSAMESGTETGAESAASGSDASASNRPRRRHRRRGSISRHPQMRRLTGPPQPEDVTARQRMLVRRYLTNCALSNTLTPFVDKEGELRYSSESADELALAQFARSVGFTLKERSPTDLSVYYLHINPQGSSDTAKDAESSAGDQSAEHPYGRSASLASPEPAPQSGRSIFGGSSPAAPDAFTAAASAPQGVEIEVYRKLATFHFTSARRRVTVVYERMIEDRASGSLRPASPEGEIYVMCKGQDTVIEPLLVNPAQEWSALQTSMQRMCKAGLRSMLMAEARQTRQWWEGWEQRYTELDNAARRSLDPALEKRAKEKLDLLKTEIEESAGLCLLGATGLEDELQDLAPEAISDFLRAGIKVWMLTGDKKDTAKNIAMACCLIDPDMMPDITAAGAASGAPGVEAVESAYRENRVLEVSGEWARLASDDAVLSELFSYFTTRFGGGVHAATGAVTLSFESLIVMLSGLGLISDAADTASTGTPGSLPSTHPAAQSMRMLFNIYDGDRDGRITLAEFGSFMRQVQVSQFEAVAIDVMQGLRTAEQMRARGLPVSLVVTREAFSVICPPVRLVARADRAARRGEPAQSPEAASVGGGPAPSPTQASTPMSPGLLSPAAAAAAVAVASGRPPALDPTVTRSQRVSLRYHFFKLASLCKSVVFAGAEPPMKERVVRELSERCSASFQHPQEWHHSSSPAVALELRVRRAHSQLMARRNMNSHAADEEESHEEMAKQFKLLEEELKEAREAEIEAARKNVGGEFKGAVTLAIGDGANDELMIKAAHVGVGVSGVEGAAAVKAADYAVAQFSHLHTLLLVHGPWCYTRVSMLIYYVFYKAGLVAMTMYYFGFFSGFSGQQLFNEPLYQFFNVLFTAFPVLCLSVIDRVANRDTLENNPEIYRSMRMQPVFTRMRFWIWILRSMGHAALVFFIAFLALASENVSMSDGRDHGLYLVAAAVYFAVVLLATFLIILEMSSVTLMHAMSIVISIVSLFIVAFFLSMFPAFNATLYGVIIRMLASATVWFAMIIAVIIPIIVDILARHFFVMGSDAKSGKTLIQLVRENEALRARRSKLQASLASAPPQERLQAMKEFDAKNPALPDLRLYKPFQDELLRAPPLAVEDDDSHGLFTRDDAENAAEGAAADGIANELAAGAPAPAQSSQRARQIRTQRALVATILRFRNLTGSYFESAQWLEGAEEKPRDYVLLGRDNNSQG